MDMNLSAATTPATIVLDNKRLLIPIYQRLFVWGVEQIDNLLHDLWNVRNCDKYYYLGVITVHENDSHQWEIVDGQQRLTFLTLLGCVLTRKFPDYANWRCFVTWNGIEPRLLFHGRSGDRKDLLDYINGSSENVQFRKRSFARFAERFDCFAARKSADDLMQFATYCFTHTAFLVNELPSAYGPEELNLYFEKMNSTGLQLSPIEVVKGKWFSQFAVRWNACMNFDKLFTRSEQEDKGAEAHSQDDVSLKDVIDSNAPFEHALEGKGENVVKCRLVMRDEMLVLHVLKLLYPEIPLDRWKLIETFNTVFGKEKVGCDVARQFIEMLERYRRWIDDNIIYLKDNDGEYDYAFRRGTDDNEDGRDDVQVKESVEEKCFRQFQAMLYVSSGERQEWVLNMYLSQKGQALTYDALRREDAKWHEKDTVSFETMRYYVVSRYWFWKLDYLLWKLHEDNKDSELFCGLSDVEHELIHMYVFRPNRSIEHLHPQSIEDDDWGTRAKPESEMHQFGNLAMISGSFNSAQSADGIGTKFGRVKDWNQLESIKMLLMFKLCDGDKSRWEPKVSKKHGEDMIELLTADRQYWLNLL